MACRGTRTRTPGTQVTVRNHIAVIFEMRVSVYAALHVIVPTVRVSGFSTNQRRTPVPKRTAAPRARLLRKISTPGLAASSHVATLRQALSLSTP